VQVAGVSEPPAAPSETPALLTRPSWTSVTVQNEATASGCQCVRERGRGSPTTVPTRKSPCGGVAAPQREHGTGARPTQEGSKWPLTEAPPAFCLRAIAFARIVSNATATNSGPGEVTATATATHTHTHPRAGKPGVREHSRRQPLIGGPAAQRSKRRRLQFAPSWPKARSRWGTHLGLFSRRTRR